MSGQFVKAENPAMCAVCNFLYSAIVTLGNGDTSKVFICARGDCDNKLSPNERPVGQKTFTFFDPSIEHLFERE